MSNKEKLILFKAIQADDVETVKSLLDAGANVNEYDEHGNTPLFLACVQSNLSIAQLLLEYGANINEERTDEEMSCTTLLTTFTVLENVEIVKFLLEHGANPNIGKTCYDDTALQTACRELSFAADPNASNIQGGNTALERELGFIFARTSAREKEAKIQVLSTIIKLLLRHGADPEEGGDMSPLELFTYRSLSPDSIEIVEELILHGADPFYSICTWEREGHFNVVKRIIEKFGNKTYEDNITLAERVYNHIQEYYKHFKKNLYPGYLEFMQFLEEYFSKQKSKH